MTNVPPINAKFRSIADNAFFRKRAMKRSSLSQIKAEMEIVYNFQGKADEGKTEYQLIEHQFSLRGVPFLVDFEAK